MTFKTALLAGIALATLGTALPAQAQTLAALVGDATLVHVDAQTRAATRTVRITGMPTPVAGIDVRPANGMLYAIGTDGTIATVDPMTGTATLRGKLQTMVPAGAVVTVDFNPAADRLRIIGSDGTNLRANVDTGEVATDGRIRFAAGDPNAERGARVIAGAYSNSFAGTRETALYDIDVSGAYARQSPPNDGILNTLGTTGVQAQQIAFDIESDGRGGNTGWLVAGRTLHQITIATGASTRLGDISGVDGAVRDIAVLPR